MNYDIRYDGDLWIVKYDECVIGGFNTIEEACEAIVAHERNR